MGKEVATQDKAKQMMSAYGGANNPFTALGNEVGQYSIFCKFDGNLGRWKYGKENVIIEPGTKIIMNMSSLERGFICWKDGVMLEEIMSPYPPQMSKKGHPLTPTYTEADCQDHGPYNKKNDGWSPQSKIVMAFLEDGRNLEYKTSAAGAQRSLYEVVGEFGANLHIKVDKDGVTMMPIVELGSTDFEVTIEGSKFTKFAPVFTIVDWISIDDMNALTEARKIDTQDEDIRGTVKAAHDTVKKQKKKKKKKKDKPKEIVDFANLDDEVPF